MKASFPGSAACFRWFSSHPSLFYGCEVKAGGSQSVSSHLCALSPRSVRTASCPDPQNGGYQRAGTRLRWDPGPFGLRIFSISPTSTVFKWPHCVRLWGVLGSNAVTYLTDACSRWIKRPHSPSHPVFPFMLQGWSGSSSRDWHHCQAGQMSSHGDFVTAAMFEWTVLGKDDRPLSHHFTATEKSAWGLNEASRVPLHHRWQIKNNSSPRGGEKQGVLAALPRTVCLALVRERAPVGVCMGDVMSVLSEWKNLLNQFNRRVGADQRKENKVNDDYVIDEAPFNTNELKIQTYTTSYIYWLINAVNRLADCGAIIKLDDGVSVENYNCS